MSAPRTTKIELLTQDGRKVVEVDVPAALTPFDAIQWSGRLFILNDMGQYREGACWTVPTAKPTPAPATLTKVTR